MVDKPDGPPTTLEMPVLSAAELSGGVRRVGSLLVLAGSDADLGTHVRIDAPVVIGREVGLGLSLHDGSISRRHAEVHPIPQDDGTTRYRVRDLGSRNGTLLNASRIPGEADLHDGDRIQLGDTVVQFGLTDPLEDNLHARVGRMVAVDELTGLQSKRRFDASLLENLRSSGDVPVAMLMLDVDNLKPINDSHGHLTGATVIAEIGRLLGEAVAGRGIASRFGGDELMAFLPGFGREAAHELAERFRKQIANHAFVRGDITVRTSVSVGVAVAPDDASSPEALLEAADRALYRAKAAGKNRVVS